MILDHRLISFFKRVAGLTVASVEMLDRHACDIAGGPQEESLQMSVVALVLDYVVPYESPYDPETGGLEILWFADEDAHGDVVDPASEIAEQAL